MAFTRWRHSQPDWHYSRITAIQVQDEQSQEQNISGSGYQQRPQLGYDENEAQIEENLGEVTSQDSDDSTLETKTRK